MNNTDIKSIIENFIKFIDIDLISPKDCDKKLIQHLDLLGLSQADINYKFDDKDYSDPKMEDEKIIREKISKRFKNYGYYNCVEDIENKELKTRLFVGDAIDDLVSIYEEVSNVLWQWENTSVDDALWHYQNNYYSHWGYHLRHLQLYIFNKQFLFG